MREEVVEDEEDEEAFMVGNKTSRHYCIIDSTGSPIPGQ